MKKYFILLLSFLTFLGAQTNKKLLTVAEKTNYQETSLYKDVIDFIDQLKKSSKNIRVENIGKSYEGRDIPMMIIANPMPKSPKDLVNDKRIVVYLQGNIHAGEIEGKESLLMLARDVLAEKNSEILKHIVLLIVPNYNPDGNEMVSTKNRTNQNGPKAVGVRHNGMMLDLNRDAMKIKAPETKALYTNVFNKWGPAIFVDCHTTNGSYHVEPTTFTWQMSGNSDRNLVNYMRDKFFPIVSKTLLEKYNTLNCVYGEFINPLDLEKGYNAYAFESRYLVNYYGLRNRLAVLVENYVYADYKSRVEANYYLMKAILDYTIDNKNEMKQLVNQADQTVISKGLNPSPVDSFAIEFNVFPTPQKAKVKTYVLESYKDENGRDRYRKTDKQIDIEVPYLADYFPKKNVKFPYAYVITVNDKEVLDNLKTHGIVVEKLTKQIEIPVESFKITELKPAPRLNQGHYLNELKGEFFNENKSFTKGTYIVKTGQKLGLLVASLLEPFADDNLAKWNFFDRYLVPQWGRNFNPFPIHKIINKIDLVTEVVK